MRQKKYLDDINIFDRSLTRRIKVGWYNFSFKQLANRIGTSITVLSHGKFAFNPYMASAIRNGIDVRNPDACMVVHIGQYITDVVVIAKGQILSHRAISTSYDTFITDILTRVSSMHNIRMDEVIAKQIWDAVGSAVPELEDAPEDFVVLAPNKITALPMRIPVGYQEISNYLYRDVECILMFIQRFLETLPYNQVEAIFRRGIYLTGEGAALRGLATRFEKALDIPCRAITLRITCTG